jgi:hypothetical protein
MKHAVIALFAVLALFVAVPDKAAAADCTWSLVTGASHSVEATGAVDCTFTVATAAATDGMLLDSVGSVAVEVCADAGQTITTAFSLKAYLMNPWTGVWSRAPDYDLANASGETGDICQQVGGWSVPGPQGRLAYAPSAGAVSSGSITIRMTATQKGRYVGGELL